jgi:Putative Actinobacterial Holin-X, holin superfamily III
MGNVGNGGQASADHEQASAGELVKRLSEQVSVLVRDELKLAQLEMSRKGKQAGVGVGLLGGGGLIAFYGVGCLLACAIIALSRVVSPWLAALIVGAALVAISAVAALLGKARLQQAVPPIPTEAVESVQADISEIKENLREGAHG